MTLLGTNLVSGAGAVWLYGLLNPPTGTSTVSVTLSQSTSTAYAQVSSTSYTGVFGFGPGRSASTDAGTTHSVRAGIGVGATFVAFAGKDNNAFPYGAATSGTWRSENPNGIPRSGIIDNVASPGSTITWSSYYYYSDSYFNFATVLLLDDSPFNATAKLLTSTTYSQSSTYSNCSPATYQYMNDGSASGASGQTATISAAGQFIRADCGSALDIVYIAIGYDYLSNLPGGFGISYTQNLTVQGSLNGSTWTNVAVTPAYYQNTVNGIATIGIYGKYRYIQIVNEGFISLTEFQVWALPAPASGFFAMFN